MATIFYHNQMSPSPNCSSTYLSSDVTCRQDFFFFQISKHPLQTSICFSQFCQFAWNEGVMACPVLLHSLSGRHISHVQRIGYRARAYLTLVWKAGNDLYEGETKHTGQNYTSIFRVEIEDSQISTSKFRIALEDSQIKTSIFRVGLEDRQINTSKFRVGLEGRPDKQE